MRRRLVLAAVCALISFGSGTGVQAADVTSISADTVAADFSGFLAFVDGVPLTPDERRQVLEATTSLIKSQPDDVARSEDNLRKLAKIIHGKDRAAIAAEREYYRLQIAMRPESDPARRLVERHDPTIVFDRKHGRLVTEASLSALQRACTWITGVLGVPGPDADFIAKERTFLKKRYGTLTDEQQDGFAHVVRDLPVAVAEFEGLPAAQQQHWIAGARPYAQDRTQLAPRTAAVLSRTYLDARNAADAIVLGSAANFNMLYHASYYHH